jgi:large subunit ribosomal protein L22
MTAARPYVGATAKFVHVSPRKARLVADHIRGRSVPEARTILAFMQRAAAHDVEKVLRSAVANAESNPTLRWDGDDLYISAVYIDEGPTLKRWRARARGRVNQILKRTCHITIKVEKLEGIAPATGAATSAEQPKRRRASGGAAAGAKSKKTPKKKEVAA